MTDGRLAAGFPVGTSMDVNRCYGITPTETRARFAEAHDLIMDVLGGDTNEWLRGDSPGPVLMHELGHLAGIDHVNDPGQVMYPVARDDGPTTYGAGDLDGLWRVSAWNGCLPFSPFLSRT